MNIDLHIELLVLNGLNIGPVQGATIKQAVEVELARLLSAGRLAPELQLGGSLADIRATPMQIHENANPSKLGKNIARAVYGGIGQ